MQFTGADGEVIEPTDFRVQISGALEVPVEEIPNPKAEVTITLKGTAQGLGIAAGGREGHKFWTLSSKVVAHSLVEIKVAKPDPTLWDDPSEPEPPVKAVQ